MTLSAKLIALVAGATCTMSVYSSPARAVVYDYELIAREDNFVDSIFHTFDGAPIISGDGTVYWRGSRLINGTFSIGVYSYMNGVINTVLNTGGVFRSFDDLAVNDDNVLAIEGLLDSGERGIFRWDGTTLATIADNAGTLPFSLLDYNGLDINHSGQVSFRARQVGGGATDAVYVGDGTSLIQIASEAGVFSQIFNHTSINDLGHVIFNSDLDTGGRGLYVWNGTTIDELYSTNDGELGNISSPDFNNNGEMIFLGNNGISEGVYTGDGTTTNLIVDRDGFYFTFFGGPGPSINNNGGIVFLTDRGVYTGSDHVNDQVFPFEGPFLGERLGGNGLGRGLNDAGQITVSVNFQQIGRGLEKALFLATPAHRTGWPDTSAESRGHARTLFDCPSRTGLAFIVRISQATPTPVAIQTTNKSAG